MKKRDILKLLREQWVLLRAVRTYDLMSGTTTARVELCLPHGTSYRWVAASGNIGIAAARQWVDHKCKEPKTIEL